LSVLIRALEVNRIIIVQQIGQFVLLRALEVSRIIIVQQICQLSVLIKAMEVNRIITAFHQLSPVLILVAIPSKLIHAPIVPVETVEPITKTCVFMEQTAPTVEPIVE